MGKEKFRFKVFTSFVLTASFFICVISGVVLFISPPGRVANWTNWQILGFSKHEWAAFHTVFVTVFLVAGIFHLFYFNWKLFWSYIKEKSRGGLRYKAEFWCAMVLSAVFFFGTAAKMPPVINIVDLSESITQSWENKEERPPTPHAELLSIREFSRLIKQSVDKVAAQLKERGYPPAGPEQTLADLADQYGVSANHIYLLFKPEIKNGSANLSPSPSVHGAGYGKMRFAKLIKELNLSPEVARQRLQSFGITKVKDTQTLKEIAETNNKTSREVFNILSSDNL